MKLADLPAKWREEAQILSDNGAESQALVKVRAATELEEALIDRDNELLTVIQAAKESGYSKDWLRKLVASGQIPNVGKPGAPRVRRGDLPRKPARLASGSPEDRLQLIRDELRETVGS
jgi:hypothetical protein